MKPGNIRGKRALTRHLRAGRPPQAEVATNVMTSKPFKLSKLPYEEGALEPTISGRTMSFHHGKHHKAYVDKLNELVTGTKYAQMELTAVVKATFNSSSAQEVFNNAAQAWNHNFFWTCLAPNSVAPKGGLRDAIDRDLGGLDKFKEDFAKQGAAQFGSGWVWLVSDKGKLRIEKTPDAVTPMAEGMTCLLTIDVWEHAYYLDYQNRRPDFLKAVINNLLNWDFATRNFEGTG
jgi:superoxide dismutase, Fe-Mn family